MIKITFEFSTAQEAQKVLAFIEQQNAPVQPAVNSSANPTPMAAPTLNTSAAAPIIPQTPPVAYTAPVAVTAPMPPAQAVTIPTFAPIAANTTQTPAQQTAPTAPAPTYSLEQLSLACSPIIDAGRREDIAALLQQSFGVQALTQLPEAQYGAFATALRGMGAQI